MLILLARYKKYTLTPCPRRSKYMLHMNRNLAKTSQVIKRAYILVVQETNNRIRMIEKLVQCMGIQQPSISLV